MGGADTTGAQVGISLLDAHRGYLVVAAGESSSGSGGGGRVIRGREDYGEKQVRGQGERVIRPRSVIKHNGRGEIVRRLRRGVGRGGEVKVEVVVGSGAGVDGI